MAKGNAVGQKAACKRPPATPAKKPKLALCVHADARRNWDAIPELQVEASGAGGLVARGGTSPPAARSVGGPSRHAELPSEAGMLHSNWRP